MERPTATRFGRHDVVERESEFLCELTSCRMRLIDEFTAVLRDLSVGKAGAVDPAASTQSRVRFVDGGNDALLFQAIRGGQPGESGSDDDDASGRNALPGVWRGIVDKGRQRCGVAACGERRSGGGNGCTRDERPSRKRRRFAVSGRIVGGEAGNTRELAKQWRAYTREGRRGGARRRAVHASP